MPVKIKRVYEEADKADGKRILVDRLWPRGLSKEKANIDLWLKEIAPSTELRKWFNHDAQKWPEFKQRYLAELKQKPAVVEQLKTAVNEETVTLLYGARDQEHNQAVALCELLKEL